MNSNFFFKKKKLNIKNILPNIKEDFIIGDVRPLYLAKKKRFNFF